MLGKSCSVANCSKRTANIEYIFPSGALGRNREAKYYFPLKREHFTFVDLPPKVVPRQTGSKEEFFYTAAEKLLIFLQFVRVLLHCGFGSPWDHFWGQVDESKVLAFQGKIIFCLAVSA